MKRVTAPSGASHTSSTNTSKKSDVPVHAYVLIDRSGSMEAIKDGVINGVNAFIAEQAQIAGNCRLTLVQFDTQDPFEVVVAGKRIAKASHLTDATYSPRGGTPLYDAIGTLIERADARVAKRVAKRAPAEDQVVVIVTDGLENSSRTWTQSKVNKLIEKRRSRGWTFVFLGANQDSYEAGRDLGVDGGNTSNWAPDARGMEVAMASTSRAMIAYRAKPQATRHADRDDYFGGVKEAEEDLAGR